MLKEQPICSVKKEIDKKAHLFGGPFFYKLIDIQQPLCVVLRFDFGSFAEK